ncbi:MAG: methylated-DNA-(protein)-cysteine S-methyltransferase DNA binding protein [Bacteroidetes bacterium OLB11]|nr:MAG: methylated-DNA-(protein)-cysteine S-methyltransferase DNA binding protein [Bacteroidetes bacterium OLB11]
MENKTFLWLEKVYELVRKIPKGKVTTYGTIAEHVGSRVTARMVGWAMNASSSVKPRVPAHRVLNRNGQLTGKHHFESPTLMQELLESEGVQVENDQVLDFKKNILDAK